MPVRNKYMIRTRLNESRLNTPITLTTQSGKYHAKRQITLRTFLIFLVAIVVLLIIMFRQPLVHSGPIGGPLFIAGYLLFVTLTAAPTKTQLNGYHLWKPVYHWAFGDNRYVSTRPVALAKPVKKLIGIKGFTADNGKLKNNSLIVFNNNDLGEILEVAGNASVLIFGSDRKDIVGATDRFYRQVKPNVSVTIDSVSSAQRVVNQLRCKDTLLHDMVLAGNTDPQLINLVKYQRYILQSYIGKRFKAWHQYMIVRGTSRYALRRYNAWLEDCKESGGLFIQKSRKLDSDEMMKYLQNLYGDDVSSNTNNL